MSWSLMVPHGASVYFTPSGAVLIEHPKHPPLRVTPKHGRGLFLLHPISTEGQRLELRR